MAKKETITSSLGGISQANQEAAGIPESPILRRVEPDFPPNPVLDLHVGGVAIRDLPLDMQGRILYQQTDEGIAENNAGKVDSAARVTKDGFTKTLEHRKDAVRDEGMSLDEAPNPMKELMEEHLKPGMKGRFLSPRVLDRRGRRGWEPVLDASGQQVKVRDMILAQKPAEVAAADAKKVREHGNRLLGQVQEQYMREGGKSAVSDQ